MTSRLMAAGLAATLAAALPASSANSPQQAPNVSAREARVPAEGVSLYARDIGRGQSIVVLHGGPDFDHAYLLPDLDRLASSFRLIYYDQRGRGRSVQGVNPEDVTLASDVEDIERVRQHFQLPSTALLGHSWGAVLALEYALRYPTRVSHLILMNPAPVSASGVAVLRKTYVAQLGNAMERQREIQASAAYNEGNPLTVAARYRIHFTHALARPQDYERLMATMKAAFVDQGAAGILKARAVEDRLMNDTWNISGYDLLPKLARLHMPTLVIWGDHDFIPLEISRNIARSIPGADLVTFRDCGHFAYLECPSDTRRVFDDFFRRARAPQPR